MLSPTAQDEQHHPSLFGVRVNNMNMINRKTAWFLHNWLSVLTAVKQTSLYSLSCIK